MNILLGSLYDVEYKQCELKSIIQMQGVLTSGKSLFFLEFSEFILNNNVKENRF